MKTKIFFSLMAFMSVAAAQNQSLVRDSSLETIGENEAALIQRLAQGAAAGTEKAYNESSAPDKIALRDAHVKSHGCVTATFEVDKKLAAEALKKYRVGVFSQPGKKFRAVIRFSNGSGLMQGDKIPDGRGMAIKLLDIDDDVFMIDRSSDRESKSQDFMLINSPQFFVKNATDYASFFASREKFFATHPYELSIVSQLSISQTWITNPLGMEYFSMTPYLFGSGQAVKYKAEPRPMAKIATSNEGDNFFSDNMANYLKERDASFDFMVQLRPQNEKIYPLMPVEDPTVLWSSYVVPFVKVANIRIKHQTFTSPEQLKACEELSYNPWHATQEHQPLGAINRVREKVMEAVFETRSRLNRNR